MSEKSIIIFKLKNIVSSFVILAYMYVVRTFVRQIKNLSLVGLFICVTCPFACLRNEDFGTYTHFPDILYQNKKKNEKIMHYFLSRNS